MMRGPILILLLLISCASAQMFARAHKSGANRTHPVTPPVSVTNLLATISGNDVQLTWSNTGESQTAVRLYRSEDYGSGYTLHQTLAANTTNYTDSLVLLFFMPPESLRYYAVVVNGGYVGPNSNIATPQ